ncbi:hypothetical protein MFIFM68171_10125 [Madurella fahalii]|uniref:Uncharacterized protein n=1 Tax=Madurella fahalii TaxID=1157608 RepID=A0ABQ0GQB4_9PEZI
MARSDITYTYYYTGPSDSSDAAARESERCGVEGCGKKQCYYEDGKEKTRIYSKYCYHHTCERTFPVEEGYHCAHPKKKEYRYCRDHQKCVEPGCRELGEYHGRNGDPYVPYVCDQHRCTVPHCYSRAEDRQQKRCTAHTTKCTVSGCDRPCHLHRDGRLDLACAVHYGNFKCAWAGCTRRKPGYDIKYCLAHKCAIPTCGNGRDPSGASVCATHRCTFPTCLNAVAEPSDPSSLACLEEHTCKTARCLFPRISNGSGTAAAGLFCRAHTCGMPGCAREARLPGSRYCAERHACTVAGCAEARLEPLSSSSSASGPGRATLSPTDYGMPALGGKCAKHASVGGGGGRERRERAASLDVRVDLDGLRERLDRDRKRLSDDVGRMVRLEREREERERRERDRAEGYGGYPGWERWYER